jgi:Fic family protein
MIYATPRLGAAEHQVMATIDDLRTKLSGYLRQTRRWTGSLRQIAFARVIHDSNAIEGYVAALDDAAAVALREPPLDASDETMLALAGYRDAMTYVLQLGSDVDDFRYDTQLIKSLHFMMTGYSLNNHPGRWRPGSIFINDRETGDVVYEGPDREAVPDLMSELVDRLNGETQMPDLVRAAMAHLNLVMIHPFRDGNGRMARCIQSLVLARGGLLSPIFMSIEEYLGANTGDYYAALATVGQGRWSPHRDARSWLRFCLTAHLRQARTQLRRVKETERLWIMLDRIVAEAGLPERVTWALGDAANGMRVRSLTYRAGLKENGEEISAQTATRDLAELVRLGLLTSQGESRGRVYRAGTPLLQVRREIVANRDPRDDSDPFGGETHEPR